MSTKEKLILAWAKRVLRFASDTDAELFAANGALFMEPCGPDSTITHNIVAEDNEEGVQFLNVTNATGTFTFGNVTAWLTGTVGESGLAATMKPLSAPPLTRNGRPLVRVRSIGYRMHRQRNGWGYLDLRDAGNSAQGGNDGEVSRFLRTMSYEQYPRTDHWLKIRDAAIARAYFRCALCYSGVNLHVHHRTYERLGRELPGDLTVLCSACHDRFHETLPAAPKPDKGS